MLPLKEVSSLTTTVYQVQEAFNHVALPEENVYKAAILNALGKKDFIASLASCSLIPAIPTPSIQIEKAQTPVPQPPKMENALLALIDALEFEDSKP